MHTMKHAIVLMTIFLGLSLLVGSCKKVDVPKGVPVCIKKKIRQEQGKCLDKVYEYSFHGQTVYLFVPDNCPDALYKLYNKSCGLICCPAGGISGMGDGACPSFYQEATDKVQIWSQ